MNENLSGDYSKENFENAQSNFDSSYCPINEAGHYYERKMSPERLREIATKREEATAERNRLLDLAHTEALELNEQFNALLQKAENIRQSLIDFGKKELGLDLESQEPERTIESEIEANLIFWRSLGIEITKEEIEQAIQKIPQVPGFIWYIVIPKGITIEQMWQKVNDIMPLKTSFSCNSNVYGEDGRWHEPNLTNITEPRHGGDGRLNTETYAIALRYYPESKHLIKSPNFDKTRPEDYDNNRYYIKPLPIPHTDAKKCEINLLEYLTAYLRWYIENGTYLNQRTIVELHDEYRLPPDKYFSIRDSKTNYAYLYIHTKKIDPQNADYDENNPFILNLFTEASRLNSSSTLLDVAPIIAITSSEEHNPPHEESKKERKKRILPRFFPKSKS